MLLASQVYIDEVRPFDDRVFIRFNCFGDCTLMCCFKAFYEICMFLRHWEVGEFYKGESIAISPATDVASIELGGPNGLFIRTFSTQEEVKKLGLKLWEEAFNFAP